MFYTLLHGGIMDVVQDVSRVNALSACLITAIAFAMWTCGVFVHRWLSKAAGHAIPPVIPARHVP